MIDQYLTNMRFAEDLLRFLCCRVPHLFGFKLVWWPKFITLGTSSETDDSMLDEDTGWAVFYIINENIDHIARIYHDFLDDMRKFLPTENEFFIDEAYFTRCALKIAPEFFAKGYTHESFLAYCATVIGVAYNFFLLKPNRIPRSACHVVGLVLFMHQMTGEFYLKRGWNGFYDVSYYFTQCMENPTKQI